MKKALLVVMLAVLVIVMLAGCPPKEVPNGSNVVSAKKAADRSYVYVFNADGELRNRYVVINKNFKYDNGVAAVRNYVGDGVHIIYAPNMEISQTPIELYEEQYRKFPAPSSTKLEQ